MSNQGMFFLIKLLGFRKIFQNYLRKDKDPLLGFSSCVGEHCFVVLEDKKLYGFGWNEYGQLGVNDKKSKFELCLVSFFDNKTIKSIKCGEIHTIFQTSDDKVYSCGSNDYGRLCLGHTIDKIVPTEVVFKCKLKNEIVKVKEVFVGVCHNIFLSKDLEVFTCGRNYFGQLGLNHKEDRKTPEKVEYLPEEIIFAECGGWCSIFLSVNGSIYATDHVCVPTLVNFKPGVDIRRISCGKEFLIILLTNGRVYGCGRNVEGQLTGKTSQNSNYIDVPTPIKSMQGKTVVRVKCAGLSTMFKCKDGKRYFCGENERGQIGVCGKLEINSSLDSPINFDDVKIPTLVSIKGKRILQCQLLCHSTIFFTNGGEVYGAGKKDYGQIIQKFNSELEMENIKMCPIQHIARLNVGKRKKSADLFEEKKARLEYLQNQYDKNEVFFVNVI